MRTDPIHGPRLSPHLTTRVERLFGTGWWVNGDRPGAGTSAPAPGWSAPGLPAHTRWRAKRWLAPPPGVHCEMRAPSAVDPLITSIARPLWRLTRLTVPPPLFTTRHCWPPAVGTGFWVKSALVLEIPACNTQPPLPAPT